jgi:hypothetical protein
MAIFGFDLIRERTFHGRAPFDLNETWVMNEPGLVESDGKRPMRLRAAIRAEGRGSKRPRATEKEETQAPVMPGFFVSGQWSNLPSPGCFDGEDDARMP